MSDCPRLDLFVLICGQTLGKHLFFWWPFSLTCVLFREILCRDWDGTLVAVAAHLA